MGYNDVPPIMYFIFGIVFAAIIFFGANDVSLKERIILAIGLGTAVAAFFSLRGTRRRASCVSVIVLLGILFLTIALLGGFK